MRRDFGGSVVAALFVALLSSTSLAHANMDDSKIRRELEFQKRIYQQPGALGVVIQEVPGALLLIGFVSDEPVRIKVEAVAHEVLGSGTIRNRLRIAPPDPDADLVAHDAVLLGRIEAAVKSHPELVTSRRQLDIRVAEQRATVGGKLAGAQQASLLVAELRVIPGLVALDLSGLSY